MIVLLSSNGCFVREIKIWVPWVLLTIIFDRTGRSGAYVFLGIHQVGLMCSLVFGITHAHWLKRLHLKQFLGDILRKFRNNVFRLKMIIRVSLKEMVLKFVLRASKIKRLD